MADADKNADQPDETAKANACQRKCCPGPSLKNPEVLGFMWDRIGATVLFITILTVLPGLTVLARREGGCYKYDCPFANDDDDDLCDWMGGDRERGFWYCKTEDVRHPQDKPQGDTRRRDPSTSWSHGLSTIVKGFSHLCGWSMSKGVSAAICRNSFRNAL